jgi:hypothetical protein
MLAAFRATGKGGQDRINAVLREWLNTHFPSGAVPLGHVRVVVY